MTWCDARTVYWNALLCEDTCGILSWIGLCQDCLLFSGMPLVTKRLTQGLTITFVNPPAVDLSLSTPAGSLPFLPERATWLRSSCLALHVQRTQVGPPWRNTRSSLHLGMLAPLRKPQSRNPKPWKLNASSEARQALISLVESTIARDLVLPQLVSK